MADSGYQRYAGLCVRDMLEAEECLRREDWLLASKKSWAAAVWALKSVAERRGWRHKDRSQFYDVSSQVADELNRPELRNRFAVAGELFENYYKCWLPEEEVVYGVGEVKKFVVEMQAAAAGPAPQFAPETEGQRRRMLRLTGRPEPGQQSRPTW